MAHHKGVHYIGRMLANATDKETFETGSEPVISMSGVPWSVYEGLVASRGDRSVPRIAFQEGTIEIMSPSENHDRIAAVINALLLVFAVERDLEFDGTGSWTLRSKAKKIGLEADLSYVIGAHRPRVPDLAVEVVWTHGGIDKLELYAVLGVKEVWFWREGRIEIHVLGPKGYAKRRRSSVLPELDLDLFTRFVHPTNHVRSMRAYRAALRQR